MNMKRTFALLLALTLLFTLPACSKKEKHDSSSGADSASSQPADEKNFPVELGNSTILKAPKNVVSLSPALTEIACDLGYSAALAAISDYCTYAAAELTALPKAGTVNAPNFAAIKAAKPEVILAISPLAQQDQTKLEQLGAVVVVLPRSKTIKGLQDLYVNVARVFEGNTAGTEAGTAFFEEQSARLTALATRVETATVNKPLEVAYLRLMPATLATGDTFEGELLTTLGFKNSAQEYGEWSYPVDKTAMLMPDVLFYDKGIGEATIKGSQIYNTTPAYKNKLCFEVDFEIFERQGKRMFDLLEQMVAAACPAAAS